MKRTTNISKIFLIGLILWSILFVFGCSKGFSIEDYNSLRSQLDRAQADLMMLQKENYDLKDTIAELGKDITDLKTYNLATVEVAALLEPVVVKITVSNMDSSGLVIRNVGSGFIISENGRVLTNYHNIKSGGRITVTVMNDIEYSGNILAKEEKQDLAIIQIVSNRTDFHKAKLGSSQNVSIGEDVLIIGYPYSFDIKGPVTFTKGIVSAVNQIVEYPQSKEDRFWIQTDAAMNKGNSGVR